MSLPYGRKIRRSIKNCKYNDEVTALLARRIRKMPEYAGCDVKCYGPFGLFTECSVSVKDKDGKQLGFLTVTDDSEGFVYVDYDAPPLEVYPHGSIGEMNGGNNQKRPLPTDIEEVLKLVFTI